MLQKKSVIDVLTFLFQVTQNESFGIIFTRGIITPHWQHDSAVVMVPAAKLNDYLITTVSPLFNFV